MTNQSDYRLYLAERFEGMQKAQHAYFIEVHNKLDAIQIQTTKSNCRITKIEDDLTEYRMIKKYPKVGISIVSIFVIAFVYGFYRMIHNQDMFQTTQNDLKSQVDMINTPVEDTRTGKIYLYPSGMLIDSVITNKK